jgi:FkbM family methyltransferase
VGLYKSKIVNMLPPRPVIIEAGAHDGEDTVELSKYWSDGEIHAFEPIPTLYHRLVDRTRKRSNVYCYPLTLSGSNSWREMHVSAGVHDSSSSLLAPNADFSRTYQEIIFSSSVTVPTTTLSTWADSYGIDHIDFMWLDMQGGELEALASSPAILRTATAIYTEVWLQRLYDGCPLYPELRSFLEAQGFRVSQEFLPWPDGGNVLFVREPRN